MLFSLFILSAFNYTQNKITNKSKANTLVPLRGCECVRGKPPFASRQNEEVANETDRSKQNKNKKNTEEFKSNPAGQ